MQGHQLQKGQQGQLQQQGHSPQEHTKKSKKATEIEKSKTADPLLFDVHIPEEPPDINQPQEDLIIDEGRPINTQSSFGQLKIYEDDRSFGETSFDLHQYDLS